jgi:hypothetical protein
MRALGVRERVLLGAVAVGESVLAGEPEAEVERGPLEAVVGVGVEGGDGDWALGGGVEARALVHVGGALLPVNAGGEVVEGEGEAVGEAAVAAVFGAGPSVLPLGEVVGAARQFGAVQGHDHAGVPVLQFEFVRELDFLGQEVELEQNVVSERGEQRAQHELGDGPLLVSLQSQFRHSVK